jgi:predicted permease
MSLLAELRPTLRRLRKAPGFTAVSILTLALGIGGTTAAFSVVDAVLLRPLPYREPEQLVGLWHTAPGLGMPQVEQSDASYTQYQKATRSFASIASYSYTSVNLTGVEQPERIQVADATASLLPTLGVNPMLGRWYTAAEDRPGAPHVVVLSSALWQRRFGGDARAIGRTIQLDGIAYEVIGVMPPSFHYPDTRTELWRPMRIDPARLNSGNFNRNAIGRLRAGVTLEAAAHEMQPLLMRMPDEMAGPITRGMLEQARIQVVLRPLRDDVIGDVRPVLFTVLGTVAFVLLIACANVANLFLVRAEARQKEIAVRTAIGATPGHVARLYLGESLVLTVSGAALGIFLAWGAVRALLRLAPAGLPRAEEISIDATTLGVAVLIAAVAGLFFGALPFVRAGKSDLVSTLKDASRGSSVGRERQRVRNAFVVAQVALALVLLVGSGLMARSFQRLRAVDPGFRAENALTMRLALPDREYADPLRTVGILQQLVDRIAALPGVRVAAITTKLPLAVEGHNGNGVWVEDHPTSPDAVPSIHSMAQVTDGYFAAMGIPIIEGRTLARIDQGRATREMLVSRAFAKHFWPNGSAIGKRIKAGGPDSPWSTIVGVVGDVHDEALTKPADEMIYQPLLALQQAMPNDPDTLYAPRGLSVVVRTAGSPTAITAAVRREIAATDANLPLALVRTLDSIVTSAMARTSFTLVMLGVAAFVALLLGAIGIYGVISYMVSLRTREIGVRMALGAQRGQVRGMVVRQGLTLALAGVAIGLASAVALARLIASLLYEVAPTDPLTLGGVSAALLAVAALASWLPARRAAKIDPVEALRGD